MMQLAKKLTSSTIFPKTVNPYIQIKFLRMLGQLLEEGFSMKEALNFLVIVLGKKEAWIQEVSHKIESGRSLDGAIRDYQFPDWICSQLYFAHHHGRLAHTLIQCGNQLDGEQKRKKEMMGLLSYPVFLIFFMLGMLMALRFILLPQFQAMVPQDDRLAQAGINFIYYSPYLILFIFLLAIASVIAMKIYEKKTSATAMATLLSQIPLLSPFVKKFYTYRFTNEWAALLKSGLSMQELVSIMTQKETTPLMQEIGQALEKGLLQGRGIHQIMANFPFFLEEYTNVIQHGQKIGALAESLGVYAKECLTELDRSIKKVFAMIQPVLFLFIAALLVVIYGSMLLPMFSFMDSL